MSFARPKHRPTATTSQISLGMGALAWLLVFAAATGCGGVQRRLTIRTNPPGAVVYVDDYEVGTTPCSTSFIYYGTRKIRLVKDGYETLTLLQPVPSPWYQVPPLDFFSDNLSVQEIRDERALDYQLQPQVIVPTEEILARAENLRQGSRTQSPVPLGLQPGSVPAGGPVNGVMAPGVLPPPSNPAILDPAGRPLNVAPPPSFPTVQPNY